MSSRTPVASEPMAKSTASDHDDYGSSSGVNGKQPVKETATITTLATAETQRMEAVLGDYVLRFLRICKRPRKNVYDLDAVRTSNPRKTRTRHTDRMQVATQPSIWDNGNVEELKSLHIHPQWENWSALTPASTGPGEKRTQSGGRLTGRSWCGSASCSPRSTSTETTSTMPYRTTCSMTSVSLELTTT